MVARLVIHETMGGDKADHIVLYCGEDGRLEPLSRLRHNDTS